ncbi:unnamed protein product [Boreogadus saida]
MRSNELKALSLVTGVVPTYAAGSEALIGSTLRLFCCSLLTRPLKDGEDSLSDPASDLATSLFLHWGHDLGPESRRAALQKFQYYGYNGYLSDRVSLTRPIPDYRQDDCRNMVYSPDLPQLSVIFIFVNEALSVLLRSVHTVIQRTPAHLLREVILVDDHSNSRKSSPRPRASFTLQEHQRGRSEQQKYRMV